MAVLDTELEYFDQHREEWFEHHAGKIALIHGNRVYGFYDNYENALVAGYDQIGLVAFLIKKVLLEDVVVYIPTIFSSRVDDPIYADQEIRIFDYRERRKQ